MRRSRRVCGPFVQGGVAQMPRSLQSSERTMTRIRGGRPKDPAIRRCKDSVKAPRHVAPLGVASRQDRCVRNAGVKLVPVLLFFACVHPSHARRPHRHGDTPGVLRGLWARKAKEMTGRPEPDFKRGDDARLDWRNPGIQDADSAPDFAALHPGYKDNGNRCKLPCAGVTNAIANTCQPAVDLHA